MEIWWKSERSVDPEERSGSGYGLAAEILDTSGNWSEAETLKSVAV